MRSLRKLSERLTALQAEVTVMQTQAPFYDADAIDAKLFGIFQEIQDNKARIDEAQSTLAADFEDPAGLPPNLSGAE